MSVISAPELIKEKQQLPSGAAVSDYYSLAIRELFFVRNPCEKKDDPVSEKKCLDFIAENSDGGIWVYFPWRNEAISLPPEDIFFELKTARNRHLITKEEQNALRKIRLGVAGMSVGSSVIHALVLGGGPKRIKIADFDDMEITNTNRLRASVLDLGKNKTEIAARSLWEMDPFLEIELWRGGVKAEDADSFVGDSPLDMIVDEVDSLPVKIALRKAAKKHKIPLFMATDFDDGVIVDVERHDLNPETEFFNGRVSEEEISLVDGGDKKIWLNLAGKIIGDEVLSERMKKSLGEIGISISGVPQLGVSSALAGAALSYAIAGVAAGKVLNSGRYVFGLGKTIFG